MRFAFFAGARADFLRVGVPALPEASLQRGHQVDDVVAAWLLRRFRFDAFALQLGVDHLAQSRLVAILDVSRLELAFLSLDQLPGKLDHLRIGPRIRYLIEQLVIRIKIARLVQRVQHHALFQRQDRHRALAS